MKAKFYFLVLCGFISVTLFAQKKTTLIFQGFENQVFVNQTRMIMFTDLQGGLLKETIDSWNKAGSKWDETSILTSTLNADGTVKENLTKTWNKNVWEETGKTEFTYTSKKVATETVKMNMSGAWITFSKTTNTWNGDLLQSELHQSFDFLTQKLVDNTKNTYSYNADGTQSQDLEEKWNVGTSKWENFTRTTTTYSSKKPVTVLNEEYKSSAWVNKWRNTSTYNADGTLKEALDQNWESGAWKDDSKSIYSYNTNKSIKEVLIQEWKTTSVWENTAKILYSEEASTIAEAMNIKSEIVVYPNPTRGNISVRSLDQISNIEVFNMAGQKIVSRNVNSNSENMNLNIYESGIYIFKVNAGDKIQTFSVLLNK